MKKRTKLVTEAFGGTCSGTPTKTQACNTHNCPGPSLDITYNHMKIVIKIFMFLKTSILSFLPQCYFASCRSWWLCLKSLSKRWNVSWWSKWLLMWLFSWIYRGKLSNQERWEIFDGKARLLIEGIFSYNWENIK